MGVFYERTEPKPSQGICYGCRHVGDERFSTSGHCHGGGHLEPNEKPYPWAGFICTCYCVSTENLDRAIDARG